MKNIYMMLAATLLVGATLHGASRGASKVKSSKKEQRKSYTEVKTEQEFASNFSKNGTYVVKFHMPACPACVHMAPYFEKVAQEMQGQATFLSVDITSAELQDLARSFNIQALPTTLIITEKVGALSEEELKREVMNALGKGNSPKAPAPAAPVSAPKKKVSAPAA